jgi:hypothetical protein
MCEPLLSVSFTVINPVENYKRALQACFKVHQVLTLGRTEKGV